MTAVVKKATGSRRAEQARATRRRIVDAARGLFIAQGYSATTLDQIAAEAGVAVQTVYFHYGNKASVLKEVVDVLAVGDDAPVPLLERPWVTRVREEPDGRKALAIWLSHSCEIFTRIAPVMRIVRDAAGADADMAAQYDTNQRQRYTAHRTLAGNLADKGALRPRLSADRAADIIFTVVSPEAYLLLTAERGWTPRQWQRWALETLTATILR
jgi:AcrR family transcriptional regulator